MPILNTGSVGFLVWAEPSKQRDFAGTAGFRGSGAAHATLRHAQRAAASRPKRELKTLLCLPLKITSQDAKSPGRTKRERQDATVDEIYEAASSAAGDVAAGSGADAALNPGLMALERTVPAGNPATSLCETLGSVMRHSTRSSEFSRMASTRARPQSFSRPNWARGSATLRLVFAPSDSNLTTAEDAQRTTVDTLRPFDGGSAPARQSRGIRPLGAVMS